MTSTRELLLTEGMRLFGEQGYAATSIAQIEQAAGLSPGSGSLYKHFRSKEELLSTGLDRLLATGQQPTARSSQQPTEQDTTRIAEQLQATVEAGLDRMDQDRDLSRLLFRGLDAFPDLMEKFGQGEIARIHGEITAILGRLAGEGDTDKDWAAVAVVLQGAVAHYWLLADLFGRHPTGVDVERFSAAAAALTTALLAHCDQPQEKS